MWAPLSALVRPQPGMIRGRYPDVASKDVRKRGSEARKLIAAGIDSSEKKRLDRLDATLKAATTFKG